MHGHKFPIIHDKLPLERRFSAYNKSQNIRNRRRAKTENHIEVDQNAV
jgi:hypothetical protein